MIGHRRCFIYTLPVFLCACLVRVVIGDQYHSSFHKITPMGDINCHDDGVPAYGPDLCRGKGISSHYRHISMTQRNYKRCECH